MAKMTLAEHESKYKNVCKCSCTLYIVLFSINIGISTYFIYYKYINPSKKAVNNKDGYGIQTLIYLIYKMSEVLTA